MSRSVKAYCPGQSLPWLRLKYVQGKISITVENELIMFMDVNKLINDLGFFINNAKRKDGVK